MLSRRNCSHLLAGLTLLVYVGIFHITSSQAQEHDFWGESSTPAPGQQLFNANCAGCHGLDGRGGDKGPSVATTVLTDDQVHTVILKGIDGTAMPAFPELKEQQVRDIIARLRTLQGKLEERKPPGDATRGKAVFFGKGECSSCHAISGQGGFLGPDLSAYGSDLPAKTIRDEIVKTDRIPRSGYQSASIVSHDGNRLEGILRNEDNFSVQILTADGNFHFLQKSELQKIEHSGQSLMPTNYRERLSAAELNDLVSYLMNATSPLEDPPPQDTENPTE
jgi:cytochrome c oxidase cbb3-type subunit III